MSKRPTDKLVTEAVFKEEIKGLHEKIDSSVKRLAHQILKNQEDLQELKKTTATKDDTNTILNRIDSFATQVETFDRKATVHDHRLNDHEKRLVNLESK